MPEESRKAAAMSAPCFRTRPGVDAACAGLSPRAPQKDPHPKRVRVEPEGLKKGPQKVPQMYFQDRQHVVEPVGLGFYGDASVRTPDAQGAHLPHPLLNALWPKLPLHVTAQKSQNLLGHKFTDNSFPRSQTSKFSIECRTKLPIMSLVSGEKVRGHPR